MESTGKKFCIKGKDEMKRIEDERVKEIRRLFVTLIVVMVIAVVALLYVSAGGLR